jgi:hypothetical protein
MFMVATGAHPLYTRVECAQRHSVAGRYRCLTPWQLTSRAGLTVAECLGFGNNHATNVFKSRRAPPIPPKVCGYFDHIESRRLHGDTRNQS